MDTLPEEILDQIFFYCVPSTAGTWEPAWHHTLHSVCLASRKMYRIARPHLYSTILSTSGDMGRKLLSTLTHNAELRNYVRAYAVKHTTGGCFHLRDDIRIDDVESYGHFYDECQPLFIATLELLPNVKVLDLSRFIWQYSMARERVVDTLYRHIRDPRSPELAGAFSRVEVLSIHVGEHPVHLIYPVWKMASLKCLTLDLRRIESYELAIPPMVGWDLYESGIERLELVCLSWPRIPGLDQVPKYFKGLKHLLVTLSHTDFHIAYMAARMFKLYVRIGRLKCIDIAVVGLWYYTVEFIGLDLDWNTQVEKEFLDLLTYASGRYGDGDAGEEMPFQSCHFCIKRMRELTREEVEAYDVRLARRP